MICFPLLVRFLQVVLALVIRTLGIGILRLGHKNRDQLELGFHAFPFKSMAGQISKADCDVALPEFAFTRGDRSELGTAGEKVMWLRWVAVGRRSHDAKCYVPQHVCLIGLIVRFLGLTSRLFFVFGVCGDAASQS